MLYFSHFLCFLLVILLFKMGHKCSAEVLFRVRKHLKAVICLVEKMPVLDKLRLDMSSAVGCEFTVSESTIHVVGVFKHSTRKTRLLIGQSMEML